MIHHPIDAKGAEHVPFDMHALKFTVVGVHDFTHSDFAHLDTQRRIMKRAAERQLVKDQDDEDDDGVEVRLLKALSRTGLSVWMWIPGNVWLWFQAG